MLPRSFADVNHLVPQRRIRRAMGEFGIAYADRSEADHAALPAAIETGRVAADDRG
ncbi:hypothetical protein [Nocardia arthritidis]|uniref:Uncharacterized protein n=1 Tax=Nocardia arthritidis TaxID=228602 RepID=A0A6G9YBX8_9NOCA|nr:hypothetical protein [Nocardia arthritidis]QIS10712.1 hypothetical protein F5544_14125 [Nocardia arthritidis]